MNTTAASWILHPVVHHQNQWLARSCADELLNFGCLAEQALPNQSLFSLMEVQTGFLCEASESSFQNLVLCPSFPQSSINAFATSCYLFFCPLHERARTSSIAAHVLDLVQAPLQLLTISFLLNQDQLRYWAVMRLRGRAAKSQMSSFTFYGGESPFLPAHSRTYNLKLVTHTPETRRQQGMTARTLANGHQSQNANTYERRFDPTATPAQLP